MSNHLALESSLYLRQHKDNPVNWYPWGNQALTKAKDENKLIIVSIGYASCHWCHVMERESFEKEDVAEVMNADFVSIKVDREERPDIDQIYMLAVQLMTGQGGWPLNMICLPDGRPVYGGTYFRAEDWKNVLAQLAEKWVNEPELLVDYAERLTEGIENSENFPVSRLEEAYKVQDLQDIVKPWKERFDELEGGYLRVPKFPIPNNWLFLLRYGVLMKDTQVVDHTHFTLKKIASGGIYDQIGGGFSRYSVDGKWHVPHFEKMLYDNALLVSLYSEAYQQRREPIYKRIVYETLEWVRREMTSSDGGFYSSLDADSEGVEGKYYTFTKDQFEEALGEDADLFIQYFNVTDAGNWTEESTNVVFTDFEADKLSESAGFSPEEWESYLKEIKKKLFEYREQRIRPALDDKILCSWNAMMLKAHVDAYRVFNDDKFLQTALDNAAYIKTNLKHPEGYLLRHAVSESDAISGFLDDYAFYIEALIALYEITFDEKWIYEAKELAEYVIENFYEDGASAFFFTSKKDEKLIARKFEIMDDVIPSSNSVLIRQLSKLG
ncbi:MAG TPA: thioredoxin domain-containing protein, partial [Sphingobacteriaceae bacterium]|nr:thioredoxin domain-containing protein [Sphingobacteriaceae bacterium]